MRPPVAGVKAFHGVGRTFIAWREMEPLLDRRAARQSVSAWGPKHAEVCDEEGRESTFDLTPRGCREFRLEPGERLQWVNTRLAHDEVMQRGQAGAHLSEARALPEAPNR